MSVVLSPHAKKLLLSNVWCVQCCHEITITDFADTVVGGDLLQLLILTAIAFVLLKLGALSVGFTVRCVRGAHQERTVAIVTALYPCRRVSVP